MIELIHGTEEEHRAALARFKSNDVDYIWSGHIANEYIAENLRFGIDAGIIRVKFVESGHESGWEITWI